MKPLPHYYSARLSAGSSDYAAIESAGVPPLQIGLPVDFDGPGGAWSPGQLLLAAVEGCFALTFRAVAQNSQLDFRALDVVAEGVVDRKDGVTRFTQIVLRPRLTIPATTDRARALRILEKSEKSCLVAASLATPIQLEPEIVTV